MPSRKRLIFSLSILIAAAVLGGLLWFMPGRSHNPVAIGEALVGGPFAMTNQDGKRVTEKDFLGSYMLVFFGFTYCTDVCPTELQVMTAALDQMGEAGGKIQPVFVTVDPERDTPETLKAYVENFSPRLIGLTGSAGDVAAIAKAYRVYYQKVASGTGKDYEMDHSSIIYLMGPDGKFVKHFTYTTDAKALAVALAEAISG